MLPYLALSWVCSLGLLLASAKLAKIVKGPESRLAAAVTKEMTSNDEKRRGGEIKLLLRYKDALGVWLWLTAAGLIKAGALITLVTFIAWVTEFSTSSVDRLAIVLVIGLSEIVGGYLIVLILKRQYPKTPKNKEAF